MTRRRSRPLLPEPHQRKTCSCPTMNLRRSKGETGLRLGRKTAQHSSRCLGNGRAVLTSAATPVVSCSFSYKRNKTELFCMGKHTRGPSLACSRTRSSRAGAAWSPDACCLLCAWGTAAGTRLSRWFCVQAWLPCSKGSRAHQPFAIKFNREPEASRVIMFV